MPADERAGGPDPVQEASLELIGVEDPEHPPKRVVRRNAVGQIEKRGKPGPFAAAKLGYGDPIIGASDDGADGDRQDRHQIVRFRALKSGIPQVGKMGRNADTGLCPDKWMQTHSRTSNGS